VRNDLPEIAVPVLPSSRARLLTLVVLFVLAAVHAPAQRFKSYAYSVTPPAGWVTSTQNTPKGGVAFLGPRETQFTVNINVLTDPAPHETLAQYIKALQGQIAAGKKMIILKEGSRMLGGSPAHTMLTDLNLKDHPELPTLRVHQIFTIHKDRVYIVTLTYPENIPDAAAFKYIAAFDKVAASFQWER
jgi:hypothetical protein